MSILWKNRYEVENMLATIKTFLKRFLPVPARTHNAQIQAMSQEIACVKREIEESNTNITAELKQLDERIAVVLRGHSNSMLEQATQMAEILIQQEQITENKYKDIEKILIQQEQVAENKHKDIEKILIQQEQVAENKHKDIEKILIQQEQVAENKYKDIANKQDLALETTENLYKNMLENQDANTQMIRDKFECVNYTIDNTLKYNKIKHNNKFEKNVIKPFHSFKSDSSYKQYFIDLMYGLDQKSRETVIRILKRQEMIEESDGLGLDIFTHSEQIELAKINEARNNILRISDDCYCLGGYLLPVNDFEVCVFFDKYGIDLVSNIESTMNRNIIDVGGFIGDSLLILSPLTNKKVYTFEAIEENFITLLETVKLNSLNNIVPINKAMGDVNGTIEISRAGAISSIVLRPNEPVDTVNCVTLDAFIEENNIDVGLIKVDIEGAEQKFLAGAKNTICKYKPILLLSIYHNPEDFFFIKTIIESWNLGYNFHIHKPLDYSASREVLLIAEVL